MIYSLYSTAERLGMRLHIGLLNISLVSLRLLLTLMLSLTIATRGLVNGLASILAGVMMSLVRLSVKLSQLALAVRVKHERLSLRWVHLNELLMLTEPGTSIVQACSSRSVQHEHS